MFSVGECMFRTGEHTFSDAKHTFTSGEYKIYHGPGDFYQHTDVLPSVCCHNHSDKQGNDIYFQHSRKT